MARAIMLQGTGSDVGKTVLVAGLCRAARKRGMVVRPFKPQNMSNNAAVADLPGETGGGEIGRAQWLQAIACGARAVDPHEPGAAEAAERDRVAGRGAGQGLRPGQGARLSGDEAAVDGCGAGFLGQGGRGGRPRHRRGRRFAGRDQSAAARHRQYGLCHARRRAGHPGRRHRSRRRHCLGRRARI